MRILLIHQYFLEQNDPGGSRFNEMTKSWVEEGHEVTVIAGMLNYITGRIPDKYAGKKFKKDIYQEDLDVWRCHVSETYNSNFLGRLWGYLSFVVYGTWAGLFKVKGKYDVILVTSPPLFVGIISYLLSKFKRTPFVFEVRDLWPESAIDSGVITNKYIINFAYWFESFVYRKSELINVLTPAFRDVLIQKKEVDPKKVLFIPNAADFTLSDSLLGSFDSEAFRKSLGLQDKFIITYVGAHGVANHLIQVLEAAELLKDTNAVFQLIGGGMQKEWLMEQAKQKGLSNVIFRDSVPKAEVFKYILASDMGASVLKKVDTFKTIYSNKTFDYMACKKPILLCIDGVSRDLVEKADCGVFAKPESATDIAKKVRLYLQDPEKGVEQGKKGYDYAKEHFDRKKLALEYLDHLQKFH